MTSTRKTHPFHEWIDLAQPRLGSAVVYATDDFFADKARLIDPAEPIFIADRYDDHGKWMDGWESRRKRTPGHDYCILRLGIPGVVHGVDINTQHFTGNYPPAASIEACYHDAEHPPDDAWRPLLQNTPLQGDSHHFLPVADAGEITHLKFNIYPDGGVARLRVYGEISPAWHKLDLTAPIDLLALEHGGRALLCNDEHFGSMHNLNVAGRGINMGDGWETARRRVPGNDWVVLKLGCPGIIQHVEVDTAHFKGNYPDRVSLRGTLVTTQPDVDLAEASTLWPLLLPEVKLQMDHIHHFQQELTHIGAISHVRMDIFPDGGISRLRLFGMAQPELLAAQ